MHLDPDFPYNSGPADNDTLKMMRDAIELVETGYSVLFVCGSGEHAAICSREFGGLTSHPDFPAFEKDPTRPREWIRSGRRIIFVPVGQRPHGLLSRTRTALIHRFAERDKASCSDWHHAKQFCTL